MTRILWIPLLVFAPALAGGEPPPNPYQPTVVPAVEFVAAHCVKCNGPDKQAGDVRLDDFPGDPAKAPERWATDKLGVPDPGLKDVNQGGVVTQLLS